MKGPVYFRVCWYLVNALLLVSLCFVVYSEVWEFSTRSYLKGFSDAIIPLSEDPVEKVTAILTWMERGPSRRIGANPDLVDQRDPEQTLNYEELLKVCGTATNAFVNLANSSGLPARRLLLLDEHRLSKHVVVEVLINDRYVVVDPAYHTLLRGPDGGLLTRVQLQNPDIFKAATAHIAHYSSSYDYQTTAHVRLSRIPIIGSKLRKIFDFVWPSWEESVNWTLLLERESFAMLVTSICVLCFALFCRLFLGWYALRQLNVSRLRLRDQIFLAGGVLLK